MRRIRVLSVQHYPTFGGPHNEILQLERHLNALGIETYVALSADPGNAAQRLRGQVPVELVPLSRIRRTPNPVTHIRTVASLPADVAVLRMLIRLNEIDVVKVHGLHNPHGAIAALREHVPIAWVISSTFLPRPVRPLGMALVSALSDVVLLNGESLLREYPGIDRIRERVFPYYPPVDVDRFIPRDREHRDQVRSDLRIPAKAFVVGTIANINPLKGIEVFVRAAERIARALSHVHFVVVGEIHPNQNGYFHRIVRSVESAGLSARFLFTGGRDDVWRLLPAIDVKVIASRSEGTTTTALEALSCGVPVVATDVGAVRDVVADGHTGFLVPIGDPIEIARRVLQLANDPSLRYEFGIAGRRIVAARFSAQQCAQVHADAYRHALAKDGRN